MKGDDRREPLLNAAESETLSMCGDSMRGNRETLGASPSKGVRWAKCVGDRCEKVVGRTSGMHVLGESDGFTVPQKRANRAERSAAESVEERGSTKGNATRTLLVPDTVPGKRGIGLWGVRDDRH
jgi:hypothetical protein